MIHCTIKHKLPSRRKKLTSCKDTCMLTSPSVFQNCIHLYSTTDWYRDKSCILICKTWTVYMNYDVCIKQTSFPLFFKIVVFKYLNFVLGHWIKIIIMKFVWKNKIIRYDAQSLRFEIKLKKWYFFPVSCNKNI